MTAQTFSTVDSTLAFYSGPAASLDQASALLPAGAYVTFRTYGGNSALHLNWHMDRLLESAALEGVQVALDRRRVRLLIAEALDRLRFQESRVRLTLAYSPPYPLYVTVEEFQTIAPAAVSYTHLTLPTNREV